MVGEEASAGTTAEAVAEATEAAPTVTKKKSEEEPEDSASPTSAESAETIVPGEHPREVTVHLTITVRNIRYIGHKK